MVSAVPIQLMSDHIFLGASVVAILSAEIVLLRANAHSQRKPLLAQLLGTSGGRLLHAAVHVHFGSDHIFLGASVAVILSAEIVLLHISSAQSEEGSACSALGR